MERFFRGVRWLAGQPLWFRLLVYLANGALVILTLSYMPYVRGVVAALMCILLVIQVMTLAGLAAMTARGNGWMYQEEST